MKYNSDFSHDLELGQKGENLLAKILLLKGDKIEVKTDLQATQTGNVFIEYKSRDRLSGLSTSKAEYWAFLISNEQIIIIETNKLKELCKTKGLRRVDGGDNNTSKGILIPLNKLIN
tara:strand:+ start:524 stop:874 length:351 start_codon:yes stop_codon:yes gene_type:complete